MGTPSAVTLQDELGRPLHNLRLSVTDRCNLRCSYCMPEESYRWLPRSEILCFDEIVRVVGAARGLGVERVRLTGGEPLLRRDLHVLVHALVDAGVADVAMTTNGILLREQLPALVEAGLRRLTISLDTLRRDRFAALTRRDALPEVLEGIESAAALAGEGARLSSFKLDAVMIAGHNDDELVPLLTFARERGAELRFIEYMDVGGATQWRPERVLPRAEMLARIDAAFGAPRALGERGSAPAERFALSDGTVFGIIASTTAPFCRCCDRARLTADGHWLQCLYASGGLDLRAALRAGMTDDDLTAWLRRAWSGRADRGAEVRAAMPRRDLIPVTALRADPHLEMHTRGG